VENNKTCETKRKQNAHVDERVIHGSLEMTCDEKRVNQFG